MNIFTVVITSITLLIVHPVLAGDLFIGTDVGKAFVDLKNTLPVPLRGIDKEEGGLATINGGYQFDSGIRLEASYSAADTGDLFAASDEVNLNEYRIALGYVWPLGQRVNLVPKIGAGRWELEATEGRLFNPGPEETRTLKDIDFFFEVDAEFMLNHRWRIYLSYAQNEYDFGDSRATKFGLRVFF